MKTINSIIILSIAVMISGCASLIKQPEPEIITKVEFKDRICVTQLPDEVVFKDVDLNILVLLNEYKIDDPNYWNPFYDFVDDYFEEYNPETKQRFLVNKYTGVKYLIHGTWITLEQDEYGNLSSNVAELVRYKKQADIIIKNCSGE